jgi:hypothetical protein
MLADDDSVVLAHGDGSNPMRKVGQAFESELSLRRLTESAEPCQMSLKAKALLRLHSPATTTKTTEPDVACPSMFRDDT